MPVMTVAMRRPTVVASSRPKRRAKKSSGMVAAAWTTMTQANRVRSLALT